jgi:hypothetical protein
LPLLLPLLSSVVFLLLRMPRASIPVAPLSPVPPRASVAWTALLIVFVRASAYTALFQF